MSTKGTAAAAAKDGSKKKKPKTVKQLEKQLEKKKRKGEAYEREEKDENDEQKGEQGEKKRRVKWSTIVWHRMKQAQKEPDQQVFADAAIKLLMRDQLDVARRERLPFDKTSNLLHFHKNAADAGEATEPHVYRISEAAVHMVRDHLQQHAIHLFRAAQRICAAAKPPQYSNAREKKKEGTKEWVTQQLEKVPGERLEKGGLRAKINDDTFVYREARPRVLKGRHVHTAILNYKQP